MYAPVSISSRHEASRTTESNTGRLKFPSLRHKFLFISIFVLFISSFLVFTCTGGPCTLICDREGTEPETGFHPGFGSPTNLQGKDTVMPMKISDTGPTPPGLFHPAAMRPSDSLHVNILRFFYPLCYLNRKLDGVISQDVIARLERIGRVRIFFSGSTLPAPLVKSSV